MITLSEATAKERNYLTTLAIYNIHHPIQAVTVDGGTWEGILRGYVNEGLLITKSERGKKLFRWNFRHLRTLEVVVPAYNSVRKVDLSDLPMTA